MSEEEKELTAEEEFEAAFDEEQPEEDEPSEEEVKAEPEGEEVASEDEQEGEDQTEHGGSEQVDEEEDSSGQLPDKEKQQDDLWANATDEQKQYLEAIEREKAQFQQDRDAWVHKYRSNEGRFKAAQQKMQDAATKKEQPSKEEVLEALQDTDKFKAFREDWGEHAEMMAFMADHLTNNIREQVKQEVQQEFQPTLEEIRIKEEQREHEARQAAKIRATQEIQAAHNDWLDIAQSPDFHQWVQQQPPFKQQVVFESNDASEIASILDEYKLRQQVATWEQQKNEANKTKQQREKRLERATTITSKPGAAGKPSEQPQDFDAVFESIT